MKIHSKDSFKSLKELKVDNKVYKSLKKLSNEYKVSLNLIN